MNFLMTQIDMEDKVCTELCEAFTFVMENINVQFKGMVYQQIVAIPMGTNCYLLSGDIFILLWDGFYI